jgi:cell division septum initiation protein DivIVA
MTKNWPKTSFAPAAGAILAAGLLWLAMAPPLALAQESADRSEPVPAAVLEREIDVPSAEASSLRTLSDLKWFLSDPKTKLDFNIQGFSLSQPIGAVRSGKQKVRQLLDDVRRELPANWRWENGKLALRRSDLREELSPASAAANSAPGSGTVSAMAPAHSSVSPASAPMVRPTPARPSLAFNQGPARVESAPPGGTGEGGKAPGGGTGGVAPQPTPKPPVVIPVIVPLGCQLWSFIEPALELRGVWSLLPAAASTRTRRIMADLAQESPWPVAERRYIAAAASDLPDKNAAAECERALKLAGFLGPRSVFMGEDFGWMALVAEPQSASLEELQPLQKALIQAGFGGAAMADARLLTLAETSEEK